MLSAPLLLEESETQPSQMKIEFSIQSTLQSSLGQSLNEQLSSNMGLTKSDLLNIVTALKQILITIMKEKEQMMAQHSASIRSLVSELNEKAKEIHKLNKQVKLLEKENGDILADRNRLLFSQEGINTKLNRLDSQNQSLFSSKHTVKSIGGRKIADLTSSMGPSYLHNTSIPPGDDYFIGSSSIAIPEMRSTIWSSDIWNDSLAESNRGANRQVDISRQSDTFTLEQKNPLKISSGCFNMGRDSEPLLNISKNYKGGY